MTKQTINRYSVRISIKHSTELDANSTTENQWIPIEYYATDGCDERSVIWANKNTAEKIAEDMRLNPSTLSDFDHKYDVVELRKKPAMVINNIRPYMLPL